MNNEAATEQDLLVYEIREKLTIYEAACLANFKDPEKHFTGCAFEIKMTMSKLSHGIDFFKGMTPIGLADMLFSAPDMFMGDISSELKFLKKVFGCKPGHALPKKDIAEALIKFGKPLPDSVYKPSTIRTSPALEVNLTKNQKQQNAILEVIRMKGFDPMMIPDGEKGTIEKLCMADYPLLFDGVTSFENAWKGSRELFKMANHESYSKRRKQ